MRPPASRRSDSDTTPLPIDEATGRDLPWHPTEYLRLCHLGRNDQDHVGISAQLAARPVERWRTQAVARPS